MAKEEVIQEIKNCIVDCMSLIDVEDIDGCINKMLSTIRRLTIQNEINITEDLCNLCNLTDKTTDKLLEMTIEMDKLIDFLPRLLDTDKEYLEEVTRVLKAQSEHFKRIHEAGFECAGLISYYDHGLEWLEYVRLLEFDSYNDSTMNIHECITKIISLDIDITITMVLSGKKGGIKMTEIDFEKCIDLANKRLGDVITAANKADAKEITSLMLSSMCSEESEFTKQTELTLNGHQTNGIYFAFKGYNFHITKDSEYNSKVISDMYHIWVIVDPSTAKKCLLYVTWLFGGSSLEEKHKAFLTGKITKQEFEQYLRNNVSIHCSNWLEKNKDKIDK